MRSGKLWRERPRSRRCGERQAVTVAVHGVNVPRMVRIRFDLSPQPTDRVVDGARGRLFGKSPHLAQQLAPGDDGAFALGEIRQQIELAPRQAQIGAIACRGKCGEVHDGFADRDPHDQSPCAPQDGADSRQKLLGRNGFVT